MTGIGQAIIGIVSGIVGLAVISVILSRNAQTSQVVTSVSGGLSSLISAAVAPVAGSSGNLGANTQSSIGIPTGFNLNSI